MENTKSYKGQTEGLIYFVLLTGSRHTDEIKAIIDSRFTEVKLGTLYAQISKMTANKTIKEFRASSSDGSRRKYYKITPLGLKTYNQKYSSLFENEELVAPSNYDFENTAFNSIAQKKSKPKQSPTSNVENQPKNEEYASITNDFDKAIDFSMFENNFDVPNDANSLNNAQNLDDVPVINEPNNSILNDNFAGLNEEFEEVDNAYVLNANNEEISAQFNDKIEEKNEEIVNAKPLEPMFSRSEIEESAVENAKNSQNGIDYDSFINLQYEYTDVFNKIFPKQNEQVTKEDTTYTQSEPIKQAEIVANEQSSDWSDVYEMSEREGIKIRTSNDTNRYRGSKILMNKLSLFTCLTILGVAILEFLLFNLIFKGQIEYSKNALITILLIFGTAVSISLIAFIINPHYTKKDLPRFINSFEIALILAISSIIIIFALTAIKGVDFYNLNEMFYNLILPATMVINAPIFVLIEYAYSKLDFFQTF